MLSQDRRITLVLALLPLALSACAHGIGPTQRATDRSVARSGETDSVREESPRAPEGTKVKAYDRVVTEAAHSSHGLFRTHRVGEKLYFEIPPDQLGKEMLLVGRVARGAPIRGALKGYGGDTYLEQTLRWERIGDQVILWGTTNHMVLEEDLPITKAVAAANQPAAIASFPIEAYAPDDAVVIDVTRLYTTAIKEFQVVANIDPKRSFVERVIAFPDNVVVEAVQTGKSSSGNTLTIVAHWSLIRLPDKPMRPRFKDSRVGFFATTQLDYGTSKHGVVMREYIRRYRLEKRDPDAALSEPVRPIVYYIDPATPPQWVDYVKAGVEEWQPAFEAAGFKNAIVVRDAPTPEEDPNWSPDDVRYNVIRWLPSTVRNAQGPSIIDRRSGEIINGSIRFLHNIQQLLGDWYFTQVAPLDPRAQKLPFPDSLMGRLIQYVVAHEVGHTLGLQHNMVASATYPVDSLRSRSWLRSMGHVPSVMDYARFNYVAQPEDGIPVEDLIPRVGPYDHFAIMWGYKPIPEAKTPEDEIPILDSWARMQDTVPWLRFSVSNGKNADVSAHTEAVGDADPVYATELGIRNITRTVPILIPATVRPGAGNADLARLYEALVRQWGTELRHVIQVVGGVEARELHGSQPGTRFSPLPRARQEAAVRFLVEKAFRTPTFFLDKEILLRLEPYGSMGRIGEVQVALLKDLLAMSRMTRLVEFEAMRYGAEKTYPLHEMLGDLRQGLWSELRGASVTIDAFRQNVQRAYAEHIVGLIQDEKTTRSVRPHLIGELHALAAEIRDALPRAADRITRYFLSDLLELINDTLAPRRMAT